METSEGESSTQATSAPSSMPSSSSQPPPTQARVCSTNKRAVAARAKRAQAAIEQGIQIGQWGGARSRLPSKANATVNTSTQTDASTDASTQTDDGLPQERDVERLRRLKHLEQERYLAREYECEVEEGRTGDISEEPGWAPGLIASIALNIDRLNYDILQLTQAMRELANVVEEADSASLPEVTHELLRQLELSCVSSIRLAAEPSALCARIDLPKSLYDELMLMNQPMRVDA